MQLEATITCLASVVAAVVSVISTVYTALKILRSWEVRTLTVTSHFGGWETDDDWQNTITVCFENANGDREAILVDNGKAVFQFGGISNIFDNPVPDCEVYFQGHRADQIQGPQIIPSTCFGELTHKNNDLQIYNDHIEFNGERKEFVWPNAWVLPDDRYNRQG